ncbi:unnamed protein product [Phytomonas sp. Hart1]|nr:unnamed protein product [Phytomonas sp. Hart1]|eukprot:CCW66653.1 unnamed protein product [Phytomonas sp. isolate Hart1]
MSRLASHYTKSKTAFLTIDLQTAFSERISNFANCVFVSNRMAHFHQSLPQHTTFIATEQYPKGLGHSVKELIIPQDGHLVEKSSFSCIVPDVKKHLTDVDNVTVVGIEGHVCVLQTISDLLEMQKRVFVLVDGVGSQKATDLKVALDLMRTWGPNCILTTSESFLLQMIKDASDPEFKKVSKLLRDSHPINL